MMVSIMPARHTKKDSSTEGQAIVMVSRTMLRSEGMSPISMPLQILWGLIKCNASHSKRK